jgi:hypothetical protein
MRTVTTEVFKFHELSEQSKEKAREWYRNTLNQDFHFETQMISENLFESAKDKGFELEGKSPVSWDLSNSQRDYVALNGKLSDEKLNELLMNVLSDDEKKVFEFLKDEKYLFIHHSLEYHHYYGQRVHLEVEIDNDYPNELVEDIVESFAHGKQQLFEKVLDGYVCQVCNELKRQGYKEVDYYYSNEYIDDMLTNNDYEFTKEGNHW